ncbi:protein-glutamate methylesterase/protein-glutamine glutaminase [Amaricoccus macauensis]|uniref:protein-glutamate methylesterase/protein-glutamine glutaminase n=1 Tax=Amaricoccus macauensis TaxID=57001 RepID=UPI003C7D5877
MNTTRVLVVDDSPTMRAILRTHLERDPQITVVGEAGDPYEAREAIKALSPDVVTLDINMPRMDGLAFLEKIMRLRPTPVIMVSSEVCEGAAASIEALAIGAFDCVAKPAHGGPSDPFADLPAKVKAAARAPRDTLGAGKRHNPAAPDFRANGRVIAIGASTGGVDALFSVLSAFPANCPPTVITQHMPESFTASFAQRLDQNCAPRISEARDGAPLKPGHVYIAPGGTMHLEIGGGSHSLACRLTEGPLTSGHRPSVDVLFRSAARLGTRAIGVILTGMGRDGAQGLLEMRRNGASTFGQDKETSLVYGMPRAAAECGAVERELPLAAIPSAVLTLCQAEKRLAR